jgi:hypothetical protein
MSIAWLAPWLWGWVMREEYLFNFVVGGAVLDDVGRGNVAVLLDIETPLKKDRPQPARAASGIEKIRLQS